MRTALRKMGNSTGMIVPKSILTQVGAGVGAAFDITVEGGRIVLAPLRDQPRLGWAEAAEALGVEEGLDQEAAEWTGFANDADESLEW